MNKAFTRESEGDDEALPPEPPWPLPPGVKNYLTPSGARSLQAQLSAAQRALDSAPPGVARLTLERQVRRLERALREGEIVPPPADAQGPVRFGARVTTRDADDAERSWWIVGVDQADPARGWIGWRSAIAVALLGRSVGEVVTVRAPGGDRELELIAIDYPDSASAPEGE